jgi:penicillin-binding protein 2
MVLVSENLNQEDLLILETKINDLPDCQIEKNITRNYTMGPIFSHVLGYNGRINAEELSIYSIPDKNDKRYSLNDYIGKSGLEKFYEKDLRGKPGRTETIKTASGVKKGNRVLSLPEEGHSLVLNIDGNLQKIVYESLGNSIKNVGAKKGAAIAINPRNGAILALVSYPSYDSNIFSGGISQEEFDKLQNNSSQPFFNRAISAQYPVGSTIKPFLGLAALQEKIISANKLINDTGYISIRNQYNPEIVYTFSGVKQHGPVDMIKAIAVSSNIYFFTIGGGYNGQEGLGPSKIKKHLDLFGWENKTGIDLPGEFSGFIPAPDWKKMIKNEPWWDGDTYNLSIGQSDLQVTPLHVALAYSAIANGGTLYRPQIVQKIIKGSPGDSTSSENNLTQIIKEFKPEVVGNYFSEPQNLETIRKGMRDGVQKEYGSSHILNDLPVAVAGKTGTVETNKVGFYNTWSSSFAPYDNPEIVFVVTIESVNGFRSASLPVAHDVLQYYFSEK